MPFLDNTGVEKLVALVKEKLSEYSKKNATVSNIYSDSAGSSITLYKNINDTVTQVASIPVRNPSSTLPQMDGTASAGNDGDYARGNHIHPTDTSRQAKITAKGLLKGDGNGGISAAVSGTDYTLLPSVTSADNGKVVMTVNGAWTGADLPVATDAEISAIWAND